MPLPKRVLRQAKREARVERWRSRIEWMVEKDKEYRLICSIICTVGVFIVAGFGFLSFAWGMHWATATGMTFLIAAVVGAACFALCIFVIDECT